MIKGQVRLILLEKHFKNPLYDLKEGNIQRSQLAVRIMCLAVRL